MDISPRNLYKKLKNYVTNKAMPKVKRGLCFGEALTLCLIFLQDVHTQFNHPERDEDFVEKVWVFEPICRLASTKQTNILTQWKQT